MTDRIPTKAEALEALDDLDDFARMNVGVDAIGARETLRQFIEAAPQWRPIEEAPMDGTEVLAFCSDFYPVPIAMHYTSAEYMMREYGKLVLEPGWYTSSAYPESMPEIARHPTHFMPLPSPPTEPVQAEGASDA